MRFSRRLVSLSLFGLGALVFLYLVLYNVHFPSPTAKAAARARGRGDWKDPNTVMMTSEGERDSDASMEAHLPQVQATSVSDDGHEVVVDKKTETGEVALEDLRNDGEEVMVPHDVKTDSDRGKEAAVPRDSRTDNGRGADEAAVPQDQTKEEQAEENEPKSKQTQTSDHWPVFSKDYYPGPIPPSPFHPNFTIRWDFDTSAFLQRPDVIGRPPKLITWMVKTRYTPPLPEPVRLRVCPEMPCRLTTNAQHFRKNSSALLWAAQIMTDPKPPVRSHPDQVFVFHNHEPQEPSWIHSPSFRKPGWKSAFNWTMHYRFDSDIRDLYGILVKREDPPTRHKNYTAIVAQKTKLAAWLVSHCSTHGQREKYVQLLKRHMPVDVYGGCGDLKCPRNQDDSCFKKISKEYKFFFAFENAFCKDYISEKFFRYLETDAVVVARGSNDYKNLAPPGTFINTADFSSTRALADHLLYLDAHPEDYIQLLKAKDQYQPLYEDWPIRTDKGHIRYMHYHYESVAYCQLCRRLWELDRYRKTIPDIGKWVDKANCYPPRDLV